jgi:hypothetical protein
MTVVSGPPLLQQAAIDLLRTWKYQPGYLNENPFQLKRRSPSISAFTRKPK